jgi:hypothetical protein
VEGSNEITFRKNIKFYEERYNYGNKIIRDLLLNKYPNYLKKKGEINLSDEKYKIMRVYENSYLF